MSRSYRVIHTDGTTSAAIGEFPKSTITLNQQPANGEKLILKGKSVVTPELIFVTDTDTGANHKKLHNGINNINVLIGETLSDTYKNISTAINTNDNLTKVGTSGTITVTVEGDINSATGIIIYTNEKVTGNNDTATKTGAFTITQTNDTTGVAFAGYTTGESYVGIQSNSTVTNAQLIIRDQSLDGYNIGPPVNQFKLVTGVTLNANVIYPIETFGCNKAVTVYR